MIFYILVSSLVLFVAWVVMAQVLPHLRHKDNHNLIIVGLMKAVGFLFIFGIDIPYNIVIGTLYFRELPCAGRWTLSARLRNILSVKQESDWEWKHAYFICRYFISPWDYNHCGVGLGKQ